MRFKTFRMIVIGGAAVLGIGGVVAVSTCCKTEDKGVAEKPTAPAEKPEPKQEPKPEPKATAKPTAAVAEGALRPMDQQILDYLIKPATTDKVKDAWPGQPYKVSFYRDGGGTKFNRLKIDLNRNEKWDEKWTIEDDGGQQKIKRQVAPADDEKYTVEYRLNAGEWTLKSK